MDCATCNALGYIEDEKNLCLDCFGAGIIETHITSNFVEQKCPHCFRDVKENYGGFCSQECLHKEVKEVHWK